ncbi:hypothetical protein AAMO2058_000548300 [Amorphochlora amoebiformis]
MGKTHYWNDSEHKSKAFAFHTGAKALSCDTCGQEIKNNMLYSIGKRFLSMSDFDLGVSGSDIAHVKCVPDLKSKPLTSLLKGIDVTALKGYKDLPTKDKQKYVRASGVTVKNASDLEAKALPLENWVVVVTGLFDSPDILSLLTQNGARVVASVTGAVSHCICGKPGPAEFGGKTGPGSKKYKQCKKKRRPILSEEDLLGLINRTLSMKDILDAQLREKEEKKRQAAEKKKQKEAAAEKKKGKEKGGPGAKRKSSSNANVATRRSKRVRKGKP